MDDSILITIKKMLGLAEDYDPFDAEIIVHINTAIMTLTQFGVGPKEGFFITDATATWADLLTNPTNLEAVKTYLYLRVRMLFDPPSSSFVMDSMKAQADELAWRLNVQAESVETFDFMTEDGLKRGGSAINIGVDESDGG